MNEENKKNFRFSGKCFHLTYKGWIIAERIREMLKKTKRESKFKLAHEKGDENHNYEHSHVLVVLDKRINTRNPRYFDIDGIHPHLKAVPRPDYYQDVFNYLDKENCVHDDLDINDFTNNGFIKMRKIIQECSTWDEVINHDEINIQNCMMWAKDCFFHKPKVDYSKHIILKPWQREVWDRLQLQNDRQVLWIIDEIGGNGKSVLSNWIIDKYNATLFNGGRKADMAYSYDNQDFVIFDLPRSCKSDDKDFSPYTTIESLKDGRIFSSKYMSKLKRFKPCKVIVFSNYRPDFMKLSEDRWDIGFLDHEVVIWDSGFDTVTRGDPNIKQVTREKCVSNQFYFSSDDDF